MGRETREMFNLSWIVKSQKNKKKKKEKEKENNNG
jgi:hypothetical protein